MRKHGRKVPPVVEIIGGGVVIFATGPIPDPTDVVGYVLIGDGVYRIKKNGWDGKPPKERFYK